MMKKEIRKAMSVVRIVIAYTKRETCLKK